jgi:hypothetical protein
MGNLCPCLAGDFRLTTQGEPPLGVASEAVGYDRTLKTNTSKRREYSLFRQGCMVYDLIPAMPERWLHPLMQAFARMLDQQPLFKRTLGAV